MIKIDSREEAVDYSWQVLSLTTSDL